MCNIQYIVDTLGLKKPYNIQLKSKISKSSLGKYWGLYRGKKLESHLIYIYVGNLRECEERNLIGVIAHELIHAKQEEMKIKEIHGKSFENLANKLKYCLPGIDFRGLYIPETDV